LRELEDAPVRAFYQLSVPKKITVMFGGPFMNLVIATVLFTIAQVAIGQPQVTTTISHVVACIPSTDNPQGIISVDGSCGTGTFTPAHIAGLKTGDQLTGVNGAALHTWDQLTSEISSHMGKTITIDYIRDGQPRNATVLIASWNRPVYDAQGKDTGKTKVSGFLGVQPETHMQPVGLSTMPSYMWNQITQTASAIISFPAAVIGVGDSLTTSAPRTADGPVSIVGIGQVSSDIASSSTVTASEKTLIFLQMFASLNMFLFLFNLVPILPLDGGHIAGAIYEGIRNSVARIRSKPLPGPVDTAKMMPVAYFVAVLLISMSLIVMAADIFKPVSF
jgi:membrane-associated protease RseP (regulator of RpoE activity)